tara:strand:+ start:162 stop:527 length:366 start_codon:yes stop_codon:yes gene_type:complete
MEANFTIDPDGYSGPAAAAEQFCSAGYTCTSNNRYTDATAIAASPITTATGKNIEYVYADGSSGFQIWKEVGSTRILSPDGSDGWAKKLNLNGEGRIILKSTAPSPSPKTAPAKPLMVVSG